MSNKDLYKKALNGDDLSLEEAQHLYTDFSLQILCEIGEKVRYKHVPEKRVSWQIDRNVNYTNVCISGCLFCNFHCRPDEKQKEYTTSLDEYKAKIAELKELGGSQLLLQGGLHPKYDISFFETLFRKLKEIEPSLKLNALGPPEVSHIARLSKLTDEEVLIRLINAGLDTLPGAGAEILSERVRKIISPAKPTAKQWCDVMRIAHRLNLSTTATMVYGHIETIEERLQHIITIRDLQKERPEGSPGFRAFICWPMQIKGTKLSEIYQIKSEHFNKDRLFKGNEISEQSAEFLRTIAISRIILNNIDHIQASWLTVGIDAGKLSLHAGADDMGSIMIEENVVSATGLHNSLDARQMQDSICDAGFEPWLRDQQYSEIKSDSPHNPYIQNL